jgi:hypothetical protein
MKYIKRMIVGLSMLMTLTAFGDSPLTSTNFSEAYTAEPIVMAAGRARGKITKQIMDYLVDGSKPIDVKVAAINKLGWDIDGKSNASLFLEFLRENSTDSAVRAFEPIPDSIGFAIQDPLIENLGADELLCYAYLLALDNYFSIDRAMLYAEMAVQKNPESYTFCMITALIQAQKAMDTDWCEVYKTCEYVRADPSLKRDMKDEAIAIIFEYIDAYKEYCNGKK